MGRRGGEKGGSEVLLGLQKARLSIIWVILQKYLGYFSCFLLRYFNITKFFIFLCTCPRKKNFLPLWRVSSSPNEKKKFRIYPKLWFYFARSSSECKQFSSVLAHVATIFYKRGSRSLRVNKFILFSNICVFFLFCWERDYIC